MHYSKHIHQHAFRMAAAIIVILSLPAAQTGAQTNSGDVNDAIVQKLTATTADFNYDREDFSKVIDDLRERFDLNIHVSWPALEDAGVKQDTRMTIQLKQISLGAFLDFLFREATRNQLSKLGYFVEHGIVVISTETAAKPATTLRTYDITDLIESGYSIRRFASTPVLSLELTGKEFVGGESASRRHGGGGSIFGEPGGDPNRRMERVAEYVGFIQENIEPESWRDLGGDIGSISIVNNTIFIRHTAQTHQEIASLLDMLRSTKPKALDADAAVVRLRADAADEWRRASGETFPHLDHQIAKAIFEDSTAADALFRGTTSGFNGQRLWFSAVSQREVLSDVTPVVGQEINAFSPQREVATHGLELIVLPLLSPDGGQVEVDVQFAWIPPTQVDARSFVAASAAEPASIDLTQRSMRTVSTAARVELGEAIALPIPNELDVDDEYEEWLIVRVRGGR